MSSQSGYSVSTSLIHRIFTKQNQLLLSSESVNYIVQHFKQPNNDTDINKKLIIWAQKCKELLGKYIISFLWQF
jgi:ribosomal protein S15P/S13E